MITFQKLLTILWLVAVGDPLLRAADDAQNLPAPLVLRTLHVEPARIDPP